MPTLSMNLIATIDGTVFGSLFVTASGTIYGEATGYQGLGNVVFAVASGTHTISTTQGFDYAANGASFTGGLAADSAGNLYGTTQYGGTTTDQAGVVFEVDPTTLALTTLASATGTFQPGGPPIVDAAGDVLFSHAGSVIDQLAAGSAELTTFASIDAKPGLLIDAAGNIYGAAGLGSMGYGAVFEIAAGTTTATTLANFDATNTNGLSGNLVMDAAGNLYGLGNNGNLFEVDAATDTLTVLASFSGGASDSNQIAVDAAGDIFGTTTADSGRVYELKAGSSTITTLLDDAQGVGGLVMGADGNLYGANGGAIEEIVPCYCPGTLIATDQGERPVEALRIGDLVVTWDGARRAIRWIGRRSYRGEFIAGRHLMLPICIRADALGAGIPSRDLFVSPGHGLFVEGRLVPAWRLINGVSVTQADTVDHVTYIHVELDRHDIIIANRVPAESFLDDNCRNQFQNVAEFHALYPEAGRATPFAPRLEDGFQLDLIQRRVAARAQIRSRWPRVPGLLRGQIDRIEPEFLSGWAQDAQHPEEPVTLLIQADGQTVQSVLANGYRADLRRAGLGSGCHAFTAHLPPGLDGMVELRRAVDGALLRGGTLVQSELAA